MQKQIYNLESPEALAQLETSLKGLSTLQAENRGKEFGFNKVHKKQNWSWFSILGHQLNDALVWILLVAGGLSLAFGEMRDTTIIFLIVAINAAIGFFQEYKAEKTLENIRKLASEKAIVLRDGEKIEIDAQFLVPGDIIFLFAGDTVPADAYLLEGFDVYSKEFIFTGESKPGKKKVGAIDGENLHVADLNNMFFMGTSLTRGQATALVTQTGMNTQLGHIAHLVSEVKDEETPLQKQMRSLGRDVSLLAVFVATLVVLAGFYSGESLYDSFLFALAVAVSVVPNGLPAAISVSLSLGMKRLLKKNVLAKKLSAVETLASVGIICTDKTGTITRNELMVTNILAGDEEFVVDGQGYQPKGNFSQFGRIVETQKFAELENLMRIATVCNDAELNHKDGNYLITGDPTEGALLVASKKYRSDFVDVCKKNEHKINEIPFASERMRMNVVCKNDAGAVTSFVKGSPDVLLERCTHKLKDGQLIAFTEIEKQRARNVYNEMSRQALRVLAFAERDLTEIDQENILTEADKNLVWVGLMGMIDPPRQEVSKAIELCKQSGIKVIMITGDYEITAQAIAKKVGLLKSSNAEVINGKMLAKMTDEQLMAKIEEKEVAFARITPEQKLRIATALKKNGAVIAMTGDGVNDAPALKKADIGVAMGMIGTDVAKEASDMILLDDNFASIVKVIKEGRTLYQNLKKIIFYTFVANAGEFFTVAIGVLMQIPAPIAAVQILSIDLGTNIFPSFSLGLEPSEATIMQQKPFDAKERILDFHQTWRVIRLGIIMAAGAVVAFVFSMKRGGWEFGNKIDPNSVLYIRSTTAAFATLSMSHIANLFEARSENFSVFKLGFFKNKFAIGAALLSLATLLVFMYVPIIASSLHMHPIGWHDWIIVILTSLAIFIFEEVRKAKLKNNNKH